VLAFLLVLAVLLHAAAPPALVPLANSKPLDPEREKATFQLPKGFRAELAAREPDVIDPVAMAFDERGRIFVAEMRGYPNEGVGTGFITSGRIRLLEDKDGDGFYETSTIWADNLRFPTGLMPWKGGLLVANAPDLLYLDDPRGTGKATRRRVLYSGFHIGNIQQLLNSLQFALDNRIHACAGGAGGSLTRAAEPRPPPAGPRGPGVRVPPRGPRTPAPA